DRIEQLFHRRHEELYTYASPDQEIVFVNARLAAIGVVPQGANAVRNKVAASTCVPTGKRKAFLGGGREGGVHADDTLQEGPGIAGPAIIEADTTAVIVNAGDCITVNDLGWLDILVA